MDTSDREQGARGQRLWHKGERAKVSIMHVFRTAYQENDARRAHRGEAGNEAEISKRSLQRRDGVGEEQLRRHLEYDLNALLNTVQLGSAVDLSDAPHVERSIVNYGFRDLSGFSVAEINTPVMIDTIRQSLMDYEPRLTRESIEVSVVAGDADNKQRLSISVSAELMGDPVDIPMDFDAEVDIGAGKLKMSKLRGQM